MEDGLATQIMLRADLLVATMHAFFSVLLLDVYRFHSPLLIKAKLLNSLPKQIRYSAATEEGVHIFYVRLRVCAVIHKTLTEEERREDLRSCIDKEINTQLSGSCFL